MTLAVVVLLLSLSTPRVPTSARPLVTHNATQPPHKGGTWYFAENGHAVYCFGPVKVIPQPAGGLQKVATFCQGDKMMVPLKD